MAVRYHALLTVRCRCGKWSSTAMLDSHRECDEQIAWYVAQQHSACPAGLSRPDRRWSAQCPGCGWHAEAPTKDEAAARAAAHVRTPEHLARPEPDASPSDRTVEATLALGPTARTSPG